MDCVNLQICNQITVADVCVCGDGSLFRRAQRTGIKVVTPKVCKFSFWVWQLAIAQILL